MDGRRASNALSVGKRADRAALSGGRRRSRASIPFLGGIYLRYVPLSISTRLLDRLGADAVAWSYVHPYDLDPDEPFFVLPWAGRLTSRVLHTRRAATLPRIERLLAAVGGAAPPLAERLESLQDAPLPAPV